MSKNKDADPGGVEALRLKVKQTLEQMEKNLPEKTIAIESKDLYYQIGQIYSEIGEKEIFREILDNLNERRSQSIQDKIRYGQVYIQDFKDFENAKIIFEELYNTYLEIENSVGVYGVKKSGLNQKTWNEWQNNYGEIVSSLVLTYQEMDLNREAESVLTTWLERNPSDINARKMLEEIQD